MAQCDDLPATFTYAEAMAAGLTTIDIALPRGAHRPATTTRVTWHQFDRESFDIGRDTIDVAGHTGIGVYSAERSIIDAFRLRHREGDELAYGALRRWLRRPGSSPGALHEMARRHFPKTAKAIRQALEILQYE
ncbi:MAG TPA: hypothetical protein VFC19_37875 [Candidatus Limnocylindrales bacterium]|nr:hypothetical protein [Candidatus Limnocylindrales bacterium]